LGKYLCQLSFCCCYCLFCCCWVSLCIIVYHFLSAFPIGSWIFWVVFHSETTIFLVRLSGFLWIEYWELLVVLGTWSLGFLFATLFAWEVLLLLFAGWDISSVSERRVFFSISSFLNKDHLVMAGRYLLLNICLPFKEKCLLAYKNYWVASK